jgi:hypothetical protein
MTDKPQAILVTRKEAATSLGMSLDHFEKYVQPHLALVPSGRLKLVPRAELQRWVDERMVRI